ncbi:MAG: hypothetical protein K2P98_04950, partial [Neisseriaceae bacterium]|nr:hypothetical protein [Neisseriaceae bacterium]
AVSGCGGVVFYDSEPSLLYRQHDGNLIGANSSWIERWMRIKLLWRGSFKNWNDANVTALQKIYAKLTPENQLIFKQFVTARHAGFLARLIGLKKSGIYKQTLLGNLGLLFAALFNKV